MTRPINALLGLIALLLAAGACGALWALVGLALGQRAAWMALVVALLLALGLRANGHPAGGMRALAAGSGLLLAIAHANYLMAAAFVAAQMGFELAPALRAIGVDMAWAVARAQGHAGELAWYLLALAGAVALGWQQPGERAQRRKPG